MSTPPLSPRRLLARYQEGSITFEQWQAGMERQCLLAIEEAEEDYADPKRAWLETIRCKHAARRLLKHNNDVEIREIFVALSLIEDFPPAIYLWNADNRKSPLHCFLREKRLPVLKFSKLVIRAMSASLEIEYGGLKSHERTREKITLQRNGQSEMTVETRRQT